MSLVNSGYQCDLLLICTVCIQCFHLHTLFHHIAALIKRNGINIYEIREMWRTMKKGRYTAVESTKISQVTPYMIRVFYVKWWVTTKKLRISLVKKKQTITHRLLILLVETFLVKSFHMYEQCHFTKESSPSYAKMWHWLYVCKCSSFTVEKCYCFVKVICVLK